MPLFNKFPYTNFHELNLDWILEQIPLFQKMRDETEDFRNETEALKHDTEHLRDETKVLHDDTKDLHDNIKEEHKQITTEITQAKNDITNTINTGKNDINTLVTNGTQQLDTLITTGKTDITDLTTSGKNTLNSIVTTGTNQLDTLIDTGKSDIKTLTESGKTTLNTTITDGKKEINTLVDSSKSAITSATATGTSSISDAVSNGITTITGEKDKAFTAISDSKDSALNAIQTQENSTLQAVSGEGAKQIKAVTDEANAKITEITNKGDEYTTTMTDLFTNTKYHADNAKEYAETAKTLKPLYWGGDLENLHQTLDVKTECENAVNKASTTRWCNLLILKNATNSPDNTKEWQCKITPVTSAKANLLAWNSEGAMYVGTYDASATDITWMNTVNLDEIHGEIVESDAELQKQITKNKNDLIAVDNKVSSLATVATTGSYNDLKDKPNIPTNLATVATTGSYNDLIDKPNMPTLEEIKLSLYPVGSIYMSINATSPETLFGGTWEQLKDKFLLGAGDTYTAGNTGGEASHTLTIDELPSHDHNLRMYLFSGTKNNGTKYGLAVNAGDGQPGGNGLGDWWTSYEWENSSDTRIKGTHIEKTGDGIAHNNMPPYLTVYMWKRTA